MLVQLTREEARAVLGAMRNVATSGGRARLTDIAYRAIASASGTLFQQKEYQVHRSTVISPRELARVLSGEHHRIWAVRFLAVMALVDGLLDAEKIAVLLE